MIMKHEKNLNDMSRFVPVSSGGTSPFSPLGASGMDVPDELCATEHTGHKCFVENTQKKILIPKHKIRNGNIVCEIL